MAESVLREVIPPVTEARHRSLWQRAWEAIQLPALALLTAFLVGGFIIALSDFKVLEALADTTSRLNAIGYILLVMTVAVLVGGTAFSRRPEIILSRLRFVGNVGQARWFGVVSAVLTIGAVIGLLVVIGFGPVLWLAWNAVTSAYGALLEGSLGNPLQIVAALSSGDARAIGLAFYPISESLVASTPYIFAGLAVALGFRCGLFNIGAEGQLFIGALTSVFVGYAITGLPAVVHIPLALGAGALGGAIWGLVPGLLKARVGAHEVINTIMMNYIAFRLSEWLLNGPMKRPGAVPVSPFIAESAQLPRLFPDPIRFHLGFFIALGVAAFIWWFLFKSRWGFEIRTVGANPNAARYAGMNIAFNIILAMCMSGALAGLAGANEVLGVNYNLANAFSSGYGFDSIALALLGRSHPLGVVLAGLLFGTLRSGGTRMQNVAQIPIDIIIVIQALVIAFMAAPAIIRAIYRIVKPGEGEVVFTRGWGR
ncbi:MAG: ABC transporter permease [Thermoflexales bacterium]|nr:ABC transporter permease [Thermoflexales bacterium]MDW8351869.1 ABC transporter permease [Anaerolineae bacterium]